MVHWTEHYETPCRYDEIRYFVNALTIPVIGNGDIACVESLKTMLSTGCAGAMISRAGVGQPWLIKKLISEINGEVFHTPSWSKRGDAFLQHIEQLITLLQNEYFAILQARKLAKYYARELPEKEQFCLKVNVCAILVVKELLVVTV